MFILSSLSWNFIGVAQSSEISTETVSTCVDLDSDTCQSTSWASCADDDSYLELCCWSCHTVVLLPAEISSCYLGGWHDIMTETECANAALTNQVSFWILSAADDMTAMPVGCSKVSQDSNVYQWNPALRADDYDYTDYEGSDGPLRVCLEPRRNLGDDDEYRSYVPTYSGIRSEMVLPDDWDNTGTTRFLEDAFTCADVESYCQLIPTQESCFDVADDLNIAFDVDSLEYSPGGCYYYDDTVFWNSGENIEFPPKFTSAYYTHFCYSCRKDTCPLPLWTQLSLAALSFIFVCVLVVVICYNIQKKNEVENDGYEPAAAVHQVNPPMQELEGSQPAFEGRREEQYNFGEPEPYYRNNERYYPNGRKPMYPLPAADSWDMPVVPMNLGNQQGY